MQRFQFSTPQGEEVRRFLADKALSYYTSTLAKNKINSLRKLSLLTMQQLDTLHSEFCATVQTGKDISTAHLGRRVELGEALRLLEAKFARKAAALSLMAIASLVSP